MSEAAIRKREVKQRWAVPGSAHDALVRWTKIVLPMAVGVLIAVLMVAPSLLILALVQRRARPERLLGGFKGA